MNAKEFLSRAYRLETRIANKNEQIYRLRALAERVTASYGREAVSRSRNTDSMADSIARISEPEMKLRNTVDELVAIRKDIADVIDQVPDISCQTLLELRYLCMKPWGEICDMMKLRSSQVFHLHSKALSAVETVLREHRREAS